MHRPVLALLAALSLASCSRMQEAARPPAFTPVVNTAEQHAMMVPPVPEHTEAPARTEGASLWAHGRGSLLGDQRASVRGDILTVVIEIDERAEISNSSERSRSSSEQLGMPSLFGLDDLVDRVLPGDGTVDSAVGIESGGSARGDGSVRRNEQLELRVAATVTDVLPNGALAIQGSQEVRVNNELRELLVTGYVRPEDISRLNTVTYDKIASARISYGGRGQISEAQRPRLGQRAADALLPF